MYEKNDKRRLYWLINQFKSGDIDERTFCDEFYDSYDLEIDSNQFSDIEKEAFSAISGVASRFSEFEEDHKLDPRAFSTKEELREVIENCVLEKM